MVVAEPGRRSPGLCLFCSMKPHVLVLSRIYIHGGTLRESSKQCSLVCSEKILRELGMYKILPTHSSGSIKKEILLWLTYLR